MAHGRKLTASLLTTFFIVLAFCRPSIQYDGWNVLASKCDDFLEKAEKCWDEHADIPTCGDDDPGLECIEEIVKEIAHCKKDIKHKIHQKLEGLKSFRSVLCKDGDDTDIKDEFNSKTSCWHTARACSSALALMFHTDDSDEDESDESHEEAEDCSKVLDAAEKCNQLAGSKCVDLQTNLTYEMFLKSPCAAHAEQFISAKNGDEHDDNDDDDDKNSNDASLASCSILLTVVMTSILASAN